MTKNEGDEKVVISLRIAQPNDEEDYIDVKVGVSMDFVASDRYLDLVVFLGKQLHQYIADGGTREGFALSSDDIPRFVIMELKA